MSIINLQFDDFYCFFPLVPFIVGLTKRNEISLQGKLISFLSFSGIIVCWIAYVGKLQGNNLKSLHFWTVWEFIIVATFFFVSFEKKWLKRFILISAFSFIVFSIINTFYIQGLDTFNSHARGLEFSLIMLYTLSYLVYTLSNETYFRKDFIPSRYFIFALIIYFGANQFLFLFLNFLTAIDVRYSYFGFDLHGVINLIFNALLAIGLWKMKSKPI